LFRSSGYSLDEWVTFYRQVLMTDWEGFVADSIAQGLEPFLGDVSTTRRHELLALLDLIEQHPQFVQQNSLIHAERVALDVDRLSQTVTSQLLADGDLQASGNNWSNQGFIVSDGLLDLTLRVHNDIYFRFACLVYMTVM